MKKIIILLMAVSIMLTSCGKLAGLSRTFIPKKKKLSEKLKPLKLKPLPVISDPFYLSIGLTYTFETIPKDDNYNIDWDKLSINDLVFLYAFDKTHVNWLPHIKNRLSDLGFDVSTLN